MIRFEHTEVMNIEAALRGMRNPLNSWGKADSVYKPGILHGEMQIGENDMALAQKLIGAGSDHRKFLRQIFVSVDITAPRYWWAEFDTYKVGTVANSCSTMHTIHKGDIGLDDFSYEHLIDLKPLYDLIDTLNRYRKMYVKTHDKRYWQSIIQLLPASYNQRRTVTLNYEVLRNMYHARKNHKLTEWSEGFIKWVESLPYANELIIN